MSTYLLIRKMRVHNANALSSPMTIGFPAMTAWLGFMHALERRVSVHPAFGKVRMKELAVSCHELNLQTYKGEGDFVRSVMITANPLRKKGSGFERPPFIEEARAHLTVSLLIHFEGLSSDDEERDSFIQTVQNELPRMKLAGGDILSFSPFVLPSEADKKKLFRSSRLMDLAEDEHSARKAFRSLMPGYVLVERRDVLQGRGGSSLDALLDVLSMHYEYHEKTDSWELSPRPEKGWLVPITVGFKGLTPLGKVKNQRNPDTPHRFAEPVLTLGEFKMPYHFDSIDEMMWHYRYEEDKNLYLCVNQEEL